MKTKQFFTTTAAVSIAALCSVGTAHGYYPTSPYAYCLNNPMRYVDPDGRKVVFAQNASTQFKHDFSIAVRHLNKHGTSNMLYQLEKSEKIYYVKESRNKHFYDTKNNTIGWDPKSALLTTEGHELSPTTILNHEVDHALQHDKNPQQQRLDSKRDILNPYNNQEEQRVITGSEQETAKKHGEIKAGEVTRKDHGGLLYETTSPVSTEWKDPITIKAKKDEENK